MQERLGKVIGTFICMICIFFAQYTRAQEIVVKGGFVEDSLLIGQDINYYLTASYPLTMELTFPDSLHDFSPYEYSNKIYYPTQVRNGSAFDSTVYVLQSFEIDPVQYLQLPVIVLLGADSTVILSQKDSIYLTELAPVVHDSTRLKTNLDYQTVARDFNFPLLYYILAGFILLAVLVLLIFGKRILMWIKLRRLRRQFEQFSDQMAAYVNQLKVDPSPEKAAYALITWKAYHEKLEEQPFSVMTTREILSLAYTEEIEKPLKAIDRLVYGHKAQENVFQDVRQLGDFSQERYQQKVEEIKHGK